VPGCFLFMRGVLDLSGTTGPGTHTRPDVAISDEQQVRGKF
jgi:hypothetical protein